MNVEPQNDELFILRFAPQDDELLSSWIVRLANSHGALLHTFCRQLWPSETIWTRDIDTLPNPIIIKRLVDKTGLTQDEVLSSSLKSYLGKYYNKISSGNNRWILSLGLYHRMRKRKGLQFCPKCFENDFKPYFRKHWRLACHTICSKHQTPLLDCCTFCGNNISIHLLLWDSIGVPYCNKCSQKLSDCPLPDWEISDELKKMHNDYICLEKDNIVERVNVQIEPVDYMYGLRIFASALTWGNYKYKLLKFGLKDSKIDSFDIENKISKVQLFEHQDISIRFVIMSLVAYFVYMPESSLLDKLRDARIGGSCFYGTQYKDFPLWLSQIMDKINLNKV